LRGSPQKLPGTKLGWKHPSGHRVTPMGMVKSQGDMGITRSQAPKGVNILLWGRFRDYRKPTY